MASLSDVKTLARKITEIKNDAPTLMVLAFEQQAKATFISSAMRFMYKEPRHTIGSRRPRACRGYYSVLHIFDSAGNQDFAEDLLFRIIDSPVIDTMVDEAELSKTFDVGVSHKMKLNDANHTAKRLKPDCLVIALSSSSESADWDISRTKVLTNFLQERGMPFIVVVVDKPDEISLNYSHDKYLKNLSLSCSGEQVFGIYYFTRIESDLCTMDSGVYESRSTMIMGRTLSAALQYIWQDTMNLQYEDSGDTKEYVFVDLEEEC